MFHHRRTGALLVGALTIALAASACGSGGGGKVSKPPAARDVNQVNPQARDALQDGGKLTWPIDSIPANFNYYELDGTDQDASYVVNALLPWVFTFDAGGKATYNKDYLTGEPTLVTDPKQVVTYEINPKAVWYDGTPITYADFKSEWQATNGTNPAYQISSSTGFSQIESVEKGKDDREVVVTFKQKFADWKSLFSPLYPASTNNDPNVFNTGWVEHLLTTAGPFKFQSYDATASTITLVRNEKWWGDKPLLDTIVFRAVDPDGQPEALANGEVDFQNIGPNVDYYNKDKAITGVDLRVAGGPNYRSITVNSTSPQLQDVNVRQALAMAIDRDAIAKAQLSPLGVNSDALNNHLFMANQDGYQDNSGVIKFDQAKAKQMLDTAGWTVSGNQRMKDGKALAINFVIPSGVATSKSEAELVQNMLAQVNVTVNINSVPTKDFFDKYITPGQFDFTVFSWLGTPFPISSNQSIYMNPQGDNIQQNYARVGSQQIDDAYNQATQELDPAKAITEANQIDTQIWTEVHSLTLYQRPDLWAVKKTLANFGAFGFATIIYQNIGWMKAA